MFERRNFEHQTLKVRHFAPARIQLAFVIVCFTRTQQLLGPSFQLSRINQTAEWNGRKTLAGPTGLIKQVPLRWETKKRTADQNEKQPANSTKKKTWFAREWKSSRQLRNYETETGTDASGYAISSFHCSLFLMSRSLSLFHNSIINSR